MDRLSPVLQVLVIIYPSVPSLRVSIGLGGMMMMGLKKDVSAVLFFVHFARGDISVLRMSDDSIYLSLFEL